MVSNGIWRPEEKILGEVELSKQFKVSRNSIRESIKALELMGILESRTGIGTFVARNAMTNINNMDLLNLIDSKTSLVELLETRLIIEPNLISLATKNATQEDVEHLEFIMSNVRKALEEKNYSFDLGFEFHTYVIHMSKNRILINLMESITEGLIITRGKVFYEHLNEHILNSEWDEHQAMLNCIKNKDAVTAKNLMHRHIENSLNMVKFGSGMVESSLGYDDSEI